MRILIADDHPLYREAIRLTIERVTPNAVVFETGGLNDVLTRRHESETPFDIILVDLQMPGMNGPESIRSVVEAFSGVAVVLISGSASASDVRAAISAGARGFLPKTLSVDVFSAALSIIAVGGTYVPTEFVGAIDAAQAPSQFEGLTPREREVLARVATGASNKEIGLDLGLAEVTVKLHVRQLLKKMGARNRSEAAVMIARTELGQREA